MKTYINLKKLFTSVVASSVALLSVGCADKMEGEMKNVVVNTGSLPVLTAGFSESSTKTYVENSKHLFWHESDYISAFVGSSLNSKYEFNGETGDNAGDFSHVETNGESGVALDCIYAVYPFNESNAITEDGALTVVMPAVQAYANKSFGVNSNTMVAVTQGTDDTFLAFKNVCGFLKLKLYSSDVAILKSISVSGNKSEKIAGMSSVSAYHGSEPAVVMADDAGNVIIVDCGNGVALGSCAEAATEVWVVVPPTVFTEGITIVAKDTEGKVFTKSTSNEIAIKRNEIQPMAALEAKFEQVGPAPNQIWYTATQKVEPNATYGFLEEIVSNVYNEETGAGVITFNESLSVIGVKAFYNNTALTSVELPEGVLHIDSEAFSGCTSLQSFVIPGGLRKIYNTAFTNCTGELVVKGNLTKVSSAFKTSKFNKIILTAAVDSIGNSAFRDCKTVTDVIMSDKVTYIGQDAFNGCSALSNISWSEGLKEIGSRAFNYSSIATLNLPEGLETIGEEAFYYCSSLSKVSIPQSVKTLSVSGLFGGCKSITEFTGNFATEDGLALICNGNILGFANGAGLKSYSIPEGVTNIPDYTFYYSAALESLELPSTLEAIRDYFFGCNKLRLYKSKSVSVPDLHGNLYYSYTGADKQILVPAQSLDKYKTASNWSSYSSAMSGYYDDISNVNVSEKKIIYKATEKVELYLYSGFGANFIQNNFDASTGIGEILFDADITSIGYRAFYGCSALTEITIPEGVTSIGTGSFQRCVSLTKVNLPSTLTDINDSAFSACRSLESVTIPKNVTNIYSQAFYSTSLKEVTIPEKVTYIGNYAFFSDKLVKVYCESNTPPRAVSIIDQYAENYANLKIYVPIACVDAYKSHSDWKAYADKFVGKIGEDTPTGYTVRLNSSFNGTDDKYGWVKSTSKTNPSSALYDGVYESANWHKSATESVMYIDINGLTSFSFYVKSNSEYGCDYLMVSQLDAPINRNSYLNDKASLKATTANVDYSNDWSLDGYVKVDFENIDGKAHRITVIYRKDGSENESEDRGYVLIPKEYGSNVEPEPEKSYSLSLKSPSNALYGWGKSSVSNPSTSMYDGVYESTNNGVNNSYSSMCINIKGYETFKFYVRSNGESNFDYIIVSHLDKTLTGSSSTSSYVKTTTKGKTNSNTALSAYTLVEFTGIDKGSHTIMIQYIKDGSAHSGTDKGYIIIPKNQ